VKGRCGAAGRRGGCDWGGLFGVRGNIRGPRKITEAGEGAREIWMHVGAFFASGAGDRGIDALAAFLSCAVRRGVVNKKIHGERIAPGQVGTTCEQ
jgi:hypothetical protein